MPEARVPEHLDLKLANVDVLNIVRDIISKYHSSLDPDRILVLFSTKELKSKGVRIWANIRVASPLVNMGFASGAGLASDDDGTDRVIDYILCIDEEIWEQAEHGHRVAIIDHELCHIEYNEKDKPKTVTHDCEEFTCVVRRHGLWSSSIQALIDAAELNKSGGE